MDASKTIALLLLAALALGVPCAHAQSSGRAVRRHKAAVEEPAISPRVVEAEAALDKQDYPAAERKLNEALAADSQDYRAWYDLAFLYSATGKKPEAIDAYRKSVAAKPDVFESNLNLGILLAAAGNADAEAVLRAATRLKPSAKPEEGLSRAWQSLGLVLASKNPAEALDAFRQAAQLQPKDPEPHVSAGLLLEKQDRLVEAEKEYQRAAELDPKSSEALAGLVNVYTRSRRLPEAEISLRKYLAVDPGNASAHLQLGRVLVAQGRADDARSEFEAAAKLSPDDPAILRELAAAYLAAKQYDQAAARYRLLVENNSQDAELHFALGDALMHARKFPEAESELLAAVKLKPDLAEAYRELAVVAYENKNYPLAIKALDVQAKFQPETAGSYWLRATSYDNLKAYKEAAENYRQFLRLAKGKFPDQEWQARHRLRAIDPKGK